MSATFAEREIRAVYDSKTIRVYQAYNDVVADAALKAGRFVAPWNPTRTTWIKPSFIWMGYRSGWGSKDSNQNRILALDISREGFEWILSRAEGGKGSDVVIQWDPERKLGGLGGKESLTSKVANVRSLQIGLRTNGSKKFNDEFIVKITDVTDTCKQISELLTKGDIEQASKLLPKETVYTGLSEATGLKICLSLYPTTTESKSKPSKPLQTGEKVVATYGTEKRMYPATVDKIGKKDIQVRYVGYEKPAWVRRDSLVTVESLRQMASQAKHAQQQNPSPLKKGQTVYALFSDDGMWYYGSVSGVGSAGATYEVLLEGFKEQIECKQTQVVPESMVLERLNSKAGSHGVKNHQLKQVVGPNFVKPTKVLSDFKAAKKEGSSNFYLSLETDQKVVDMLNPFLGLYKCAVFANYGGKGGYPSGQMLALLHASSSCVHLTIPAKIKKAVAECFVDNTDEFAFSFFWSVSDISEIQGRPKGWKKRKGRGNGEGNDSRMEGVGSVNVVHHAWTFSDVQPGQRRSALVPMGVFNIGALDTTPGRDWKGVLMSCPGKESKGDRDAAIGRLRPCRVSVHADKRNKWAMCCSPNNGKIYYDKKLPLIAFWTAAVDQGSKPARVIVQLNWVLTSPNLVLFEILQKNHTLPELLDALSKQAEGLAKAGCSKEPVAELNRVFIERRLQ